MRDAAVLVLVVLVAAAVWWMWPVHVTPLTTPAVDPAPAERTGDPETPAPVHRADLQEPPAGTTAPARMSTRARRVPVTLVAYALDHPERPGPDLDGFRYRLTDRSDRLVDAQARVDSGHVLLLGVGAYRLHTALDGRISPAPVEFEITRDSRPVTLRLPFRPIEASLAIEVLDRMTKARVAGFRLTIVTADQPEAEPATRFVPKPDGNPYTVPARRGQRLTVKVEADGYQPAAPIEVTFDGKQDHLARKVFLVTAARATGVSFAVTDEATRPVPHLLVSCRRRDAQGSYQPLWRRRANRPDGDYRLPELAAGAYQVELRAVDADGLPTLRRPHTVEFTFTGNEHIHENVTLATGGGLELRLTDPDGKVIGKGVTIALTHPDGQVRESVWWPVVDGKPDPELARSADHLVRDHPARIDPCLPAGWYTVELSWQGGPAVRRQVTIRAGETTVLAVQLPAR